MQGSLKASTSGLILQTLNDLCHLNGGRTFPDEMTDYADAMAVMTSSPGEKNGQQIPASIRMEHSHRWRS